MCSQFNIIAPFRIRQATRPVLTFALTSKANEKPVESATPASLCLSPVRDLGNDFVLRSAAVRPPRRRAGPRASYPNPRHTKRKHPNRRPAGRCNPHCRRQRQSVARPRSLSSRSKSASLSILPRNAKACACFIAPAISRTSASRPLLLAQGVRVEFVVQRNFYNNVVRVEGLKEPPTRSRGAGIHAAHSG